MYRAYKGIVNKIKSKLTRDTDLYTLINRIWGGEEESDLSFSEVSRYHLSMVSDGRDYVSDATWNDFNMDDVFLLVNRTCSVLGAQFLYHNMHSYEKDVSALRKKFDIYRDIQNREASVIIIAKILLRLRNKRSAHISTILFESLPSKPRYFPLIILMSLLFGLSLVGFVLVSKSFFAGVIVFGINVVRVVNTGNSVL